MFKKIFPVMVVLLLAVAAAAACAPAAPTPAKVETVKVGDLGYMADLAFYIAKEKGYFAQEGIEPDFARFRSAADMIAPMSTGELQVGGGAITIGLFNAIGRGMGVRAVATRTYPVPPLSGNWYMVRSDMKDKIKTIADLKGKKVNLIAPGTNTYYTIGKALEKVGLSLKDIEVVHLAAPETAVAFEKKAIDVAMVVEPTPTLIEKAGTAFKWMYQEDPIGPLQVAIVMYSQDWAKKNDALAKRFMVAYVKGLRDYYDAMVRKPIRKEVVDIGMKYTTMKDAAQYDQVAWSNVQPDGGIDEKSLMDQHDWYFSHGYTDTKLTVDKIIDNTYVNYAVQKLGKYKK
ncbi:MAG: ABC transporter substrate-binding protein [Chloroflexi bacterium]|nr:ABC transporter substrate-binding protein [Chloroflexota bacterium]